MNEHAMSKYRVTLAVEAKDAEEAGAFAGTLGAPKHLQWDRPLACETLEVEFLEALDPDSIEAREAVVEAITEHIQGRREDPEFAARLDVRLEEDALVLELLKDGATDFLSGPRTCFLIVYAGGAEEQLTLHASSDPGFIGQLACEDFGGEPNGPGSVADAVFALADGPAGAFFSVPDLNTFGVAFHSQEVPNARILQMVLSCSEEQATHVRALVDRHQNQAIAGSPSIQKARTYSVLEDRSDTDMIPVCPECVSEDVEESEGSDPDGWRCGNCGARFDVPLQASS